METRVYTALNGHNEEVEVHAIDELMEMIATEWKRCRKARADLAEAEFYVKAHTAEVARSEHRLEVLGRILTKFGLAEAPTETVAR